MRTLSLSMHLSYLAEVNELDEEITEDEITFLIDVSVTKVDNFE